MRVLVIGATGGSGRAALVELVRRGHSVTALVRNPRGLADLSEQVHVISGDLMNRDDVSRAVAGQDAVVVTVGIRENPFRVRMFGPARTPADVRSAGTRNVIDAMRAHGVRRLVVQTSYGVGPTRELLAGIDKLFFALVLKPQIADTEVQQRDVEQSGLDWVLAQPVHLTDKPTADPETALRSTTGERAGSSISRAAVGFFLADAVESDRYLGQTVSLSEPAHEVAQARGTTRRDGSPASRRAIATGHD